MKEWEERAIDIVAEAKQRVNKEPEEYPLGWEESAIFNLQQEMKENFVFSDEKFDGTRIDLATQIINNVLGGGNEDNYTFFIYN